MTSQRTSPRSGLAARPPLLFVAAALTCATALGWTYWAFVRTTTGQFADESAWREAGAITPDTQVLGFLGFLDTLPAVSIVVAAVAILFIAVARRRYATAMTASAVIVASNLTTQLLKNVVFDRPDRGVATLAFNSLPSGHTTLAASAAAAVFLMVSPRWRPFAATVGGACSVLAGSATFINLWHRPADVVAALLVVGTWTILGGLVIHRTADRRMTTPGAGWASARGWVALCAVVGIGSLTLSAALYLYVRGTGLAAEPGTASVPIYFWWGLAWIVGVGFTLAAAAAWLFAGQERRRRPSSLLGDGELR